MDQLASIGCEFLDDSLDKIHSRNVEYYEKHQHTATDKPGLFARYFRFLISKAKSRERPWALRPIFDGNRPVRPWSLHTTVAVENPLYNIAGNKVREPGLYKQVDPMTGHRTNLFLVDTNERIHPSVRVRLACEGLGPNDSGLWRCPSLLRNWRPRLVDIDVYDPISKDATWGPPGVRDASEPDRAIAIAEEESNKSSEVLTSADAELGHTAGPHRWVWEYVGNDANPPYEKTMIEENMGPFERHLLNLSRGKVPIHRYAKHNPAELKAARHSSTGPR